MNYILKYFFKKHVQINESHCRLYYCGGKNVNKTIKSLYIYLSNRDLTIVKQKTYMNIFQ